MYTQQLIEEIFAFAAIEKELNLLWFHIKNEDKKLNDGALEWMEETLHIFSEMKKVGSNFIGKSFTLLKEEYLIEKNEALQERITDACKWFLPRIIQLRKAVFQHPLVTDHKETATTINEHLNASILAISLGQHLIEFCAAAFTVTGFLQHKLDYAVPKVKLNSYAAGKTAASLTTGVDNPLLYMQLQEWRSGIIEATDLPVYLVSKSSELKEICTYLPHTSQELMKIKGFGAAKVGKYGEEILAMVQEYAAENDLESLMADYEVDTKSKKPVKEKKKKGPDTKTVSYDMYKAGKTLEEIAKERGFIVSTIEGHLSEFIIGGMLPIENFVSQEQQDNIKALLVGEGLPFKELREKLNGEVSYGQIKIVKEMLRKEEGEVE